MARQQQVRVSMADALSQDVRSQLEALKSNLRVMGVPSNPLEAKKVLPINLMVQSRKCPKCNHEF